MKKHDIVYVLKNDIEPYELRYSLRSLKNFPHSRVWFFGGVPAYLKADREIYIEQKGETPWARVCFTLKWICETEELTDDFWLFNDDFFIMKPVGEYQPRYNGDLISHAEEIEARNGGESRYTSQLWKTAELLKAEGLSIRNYAVHMPMLINKAKALRVLMQYPDAQIFRSMYGNFYDIGGIDTKDVKIATISEAPAEDAELLSTADNSWLVGKVGAYIRACFPEPCEYEIDIGKQDNDTE